VIAAAYARESGARLRARRSHGQERSLMIAPPAPTGEDK
jgi:hypothetical protein